MAQAPVQPYAHERQVALEAVTLAAQLCQRVRQTIRPEAIEKRDRSPVTVADFGSQAVICKLLSQAFPDDVIVAEEDATALSQPDMATYLAQVTDHVQAVVPGATPDSVIDWIGRGNGQVGARYWTLDPIDGTKGFLRGEQYAVALALVEAGQIKVGVLACPAFAASSAQPEGQGSLFVAVRDQGATVLPLSAVGEPVGEASPAQVVQAGDGANFRLVESVESGHGDHVQQAAVAEAIGITAASIRMDSQAKYAAVASGQAVLYLRLPSPKTPDYREKIWDHAAGVIVVEEAGGKVTDMHGKPLDFSLDSQLVANQGVVVSNGTCHQSVIEALETTQA
ncbi:MAG: 3'(2'),5'-bisphosphate nucleotidase [Elainella sp.]